MGNNEEREDADRFMAMVEHATVLPALTSEHAELMHGYGFHGLAEQIERQIAEDAGQLPLPGIPEGDCA